MEVLTNITPSFPSTFVASITAFAGIFVSKRGVLRSFLTARNVTKQIELLMEHLGVLLQNLALSATPKFGSVELETIMGKDTLHFSFSRSLEW